jgi:hypothetical protein
MRMVWALMPDKFSRSFMVNECILPHLILIIQMQGQFVLNTEQESLTKLMFNLKSAGGQVLKYFINQLVPGRYD